MQLSRFYYFLIVAFTSILVGCTTSPPATETSDVIETNTVSQHLALAREANSPIREHHLLLAVGLLIDEGQIEEAKKWMLSIKPSQIEPDERPIYVFLQARIHLIEGHPEKSITLLNDPEFISQSFSTPTATQIIINDLKTSALALTGELLSSAQERVFIYPLISNEDQKRYYRDRIWEALLNTPLADLTQALGNPYLQKTLTGWIELALIAKQSHGNLDEQVASLNNWELQWIDHPAAQNVPGGLNLLRELAANKPQQIAILLPVEGKLAPVGKAIRDGILFAHYQSPVSSRPKIKLYNTAGHTPVTELYQQAVDEGAEIIIGPLSKQKVAELFDYPALNTPIISLNSLGDYGVPPKNMVLFSLSPEQEAAQVAKRALLENHHRAAVIFSNSDWGVRLAESFTQNWQATDGEVADAASYSDRDELSPIVKELLHIDESEKRIRWIRQIIPQRVYGEPRRRQDIDFIFLVARPSQARSIKPILAFHYARNIPVYSTSTVYSGHPDSTRDTDLDNIRFIDMPWILKDNSPRRQKLEASLGEPIKTYSRMYALGIDAYLLHPLLPQLQHISGSRFFGETGTLSVNQQQEIERQLVWNIFKRGVPKRLPNIQGVKQKSRSTSLISDQQQGEPLNEITNEAHHKKIQPNKSH